MSLQWRSKELESLVIDDQRGSNQRLRTDAGVPDRETGVSLAEITDGPEGSIMRCAIPHDPCTDDVGITAARVDNVHKAHVLIRISAADLGPRQWLGLVGHELLGSIHASIIPCR
ncbi:MAG: hypothetical protein IPQ07_37560 [Myxococcales bacterium]|nr:hypothetical protein [Myxococcales bacterium]